MIEADCTQHPVWAAIQIIIDLFFQRLQQLLPVEIPKLNRNRAET